MLSVIFAALAVISCVVVCFVMNTIDRMKMGQTKMPLWMGKMITVLNEKYEAAKSPATNKHVAPNDKASPEPTKEQNPQADERTDGRTDEWTNGRTDYYPLTYYPRTNPVNANASQEKIPQAAPANANAFPEQNTTANDSQQKNTQADPTAIKKPANDTSPSTDLPPDAIQPVPTDDNASPQPTTALPDPPLTVHPI